MPARSLRQYWKAGFCLLTATLLLALPARADNAGTASLTVRIENVNPQWGMLRLGLCDAAGYAHDTDPLMGADVTAEPGMTTITLTGLAPGTYAIEAYQDLNSNDKMDKSWLGLPLEPFGFSRDAR